MDNNNINNKQIDIKMNENSDDGDNNNIMVEINPLNAVQNKQDSPSSSCHS